MDLELQIDLDCLKEDINLGNIRSVPAKTVMVLVDRIEKLEYDLEQERVISRSFSEMVKLLKRGVDL